VVKKKKKRAQKPGPTLNRLKKPKNVRFPKKKKENDVIVKTTDRFGTRFSGGKVTYPEKNGQGGSVDRPGPRIFGMRPEIPPLRRNSSQGKEREE